MLDGKFLVLCSRRGSFLGRMGEAGLVLFLDILP